MTAFYWRAASGDLRHCDARVARLPGGEDVAAIMARLAAHSAASARRALASVSVTDLDAFDNGLRIEFTSFAVRAVIAYLMFVAGLLVLELAPIP